MHQQNQPMRPTESSANQEENRQECVEATGMQHNQVNLYILGICSCKILYRAIWDQVRLIFF